MRLCQHADFEVLRRRRRTLPLAVSNSARHWLVLSGAKQLQKLKIQKKPKANNISCNLRDKSDAVHALMEPFKSRRRSIVKILNSFVVFTRKIWINCFKGHYWIFSLENLNQKTSSKNHLPFFISVLMSFESIYYEKHSFNPSKYRTMPQ